MIEETAIVARVENHQVWVETNPKHGCGGCLQKSSCSTSVLDKFMKKRAVVVDSDIELKKGDEVVIGIDEGLLIRASVLLYLVPLCIMVSAAGIAQWLLPESTAHADLIIAISAISGLALSLWLISSLQNSWFFPYFSRPVVVKKI